MSDKHYTPPRIARQLVQAVQRRRIKRVADFAVGAGELLIAARSEWPSVDCVGLDIDGRALSQLRKRAPDWRLYKTDFLDEKAVAKRLPPNLTNSFDAILLNPPFSSRFQHKVQVRTPSGCVIKSGKAIGFVLRSLLYSRRGTRIVAILPSGSRHSMRDASAWSYLEKHCSIELLSSLGNDIFPNCNASSEIYRFTITCTIYTAAQNLPSSSKAISTKPDVIIVRGSTPIHKTGPQLGLRVLHTTDMLNSRIVCSERYAQNGILLTERLHILIPRVGKPRIDKICIHKPRNVVLSDCVIGVTSDSVKTLRSIHALLKKKWSTFSQLYRGTGAQYISIKTLGDFLESNGFTWAFTSSRGAQTRQISTEKQET